MAKIKVKRMVALTFILAMIMGIAVSGLAVNEDNYKSLYYDRQRAA